MLVVAFVAGLVFGRILVISDTTDVFTVGELDVFEESVVAGGLEVVVVVVSATDVVVVSSAVVTVDCAVVSMEVFAEDCVEEKAEFIVVASLVVAANDRVVGVVTAVGIVAVVVIELSVD